MPPPKRLLHAAATQSSTPPDTLPAHHIIAQVVRGAGNNLFEARFPALSAANDEADVDSITTGAAEPTTGLVEMPARFRKAIWVRNGGFIVVDRAALNGARQNKLAGEIVNVVRGVEGWRRMPYWPKEFAKHTGTFDDSDDGADDAADGDDAGSSDEEAVRRGGQGKNVGEMPPSDSEHDDEDEAANDSWRSARADVVYKVAEESRHGKK